jgi:hypothetical protein
VTLLLLLNQTASVAPTPGAGERVFTVTNDIAATEDLIIGTVSIEDDEGSAFSITDDGVSSTTLAAGQSGYIVVAFDPNTEGEHVATLRIPSNDPDGVSDITLRGSAVEAPAPIIAVDPASWNAGSAAGSASNPSVTLTVSNAGNALLTVGTVVLAGTSFTEIADTASGATLDPGETAIYTVRFTPSTTGAKTGSVTIPSDGGADVVIALSGTGTKVLTVTPTSWDAGSVTVTGGTSTLTATVRSTGTVGVTVGTVAVTGTGFAKGTDNASSVALAPTDQSRTVQVVFDPASSGAKTGDLVVPSDATAGTVTVPLTGNGVADTVTPVPPPEPEPDPPESVSLFYLGRQPTPIALPATYDDGWYRVTTDPARAMTVVKEGPGVAYAPTINAKSGERTLHATWVGPEMAEQTVTTTFTCYLPEAYRSSSLGGYVTSALRFMIWRAASSTLSFGSILSHATPVEPWRTVEDPLPRRFPAGADLSWSATFDFEEGDRLVVQAGCRVASGGPTTEAGTRVRYGGTSFDSDVTTATEPQPNRASWISFTVPLLVLPD